MPAMPPASARLTIGALLCTLACNKPETAGTDVDSPNPSGAGAERNATSTTPGSTQAIHHSTLGAVLVAVARTKPNEATPCERTCGRVGDCLIDEQTVNHFDAGRLELECLDLCVHTPAEAAPHTALLGCEQRSSCGELLTCARASWEPLVAIRQSPTIEGVAAIGDPCKAGCQWLFSCIYTGAPPGQAYMAPEYEEQVRYCENACDTYGPTEREIYARLAECLPDYCSSGRFDQCMGY
jgi:hypothetical protein